MKTFTKATLVVFAVIASAFAGGCSDGDPWQVGDRDLNIAPGPQIIQFYADPSAVKAGESTTIGWEVAGADLVEITAVSEADETPQVVVSDGSLTGSAPVNDLRSTTHFTLTATMSAPVEDSGAKAQEAVPPPSGASFMSQTITVTVEGSTEISASIEADLHELVPGEQTVIRWSVSPAEGVAIEVSSDSGEPIAATAECDGDIQEILSQPVSDEFPAVGCAVVAPDSNTVYTVKAASVSDSANFAEDSVEIKVEEVKPEAEIRVNGDRETRITSTEDEVEVTWVVSPVDAEVTVTANPPVESCTPELPVGLATEVTSARCKLSAIPTVFSIEAKVGNMPSAVSTAEVRQSAVKAGIDIRSDEWAFEGETVGLEIMLKAGIDPTAILEVQITDRDEGIKHVSVLPTVEPVRVVVPMDGVTVTMVDATGEAHAPKTAVRAIPTDPISVGEDNTVTKLALDPNDPSKRLVGLHIPGYNKGKVRILVNSGDPRDIDFATLLKKELYGTEKPKYWHDETMDEFINTFPVNALTVHPTDSSKILMGTTGGAFYSTDGGKSFAIVFPGAFVSKTGKDHPLSHNTCRGKVQTNAPHSKYNKNRIVGFNQFCDIAVGKGGRFIAATDTGAFTIANIDDYMPLTGISDRQKEIKGHGSVLFGHVVDDIECLDDECMTALAATDTGVFKSVDGGESWEAFGSMNAAAFSIAVLGDQVFAGTEDGVYSSGLAQGSWTKLGLAGFKVFALAVDPNMGPFGVMLLAGTDRGVQVTRDTGKNWSAVEAAGSEESLSVAIASAPGSLGRKVVGVMVGSGSSVIAGKTEVSIKDVADSGTAELSDTAMKSAGRAPVSAAKLMIK
ncbi:MAG TPA: hypothetical protein PLZ86_01765 [bacterium]|nr:hypothetical protein [bacterium]